MMAVTVALAVRTRALAMAAVAAAVAAAVVGSCGSGGGGVGGGGGDFPPFCSPDGLLRDEIMPQYSRGIFHTCMKTTRMLFMPHMHLAKEL